MAHPEVDVVLCLTPPDWHADVALQAIAAGKHVHTEKPLATSARGRAARARRGGRGRRARRLRARHVPRPRRRDGARGDRGRRHRHPRGRARADARRAAGGLAPVAGVPVRRALRAAARPRAPTGWRPPCSCSAPSAGVTALATRPREEGVIATGPLAGTRFPIIEPTRVTSVLEHPARGADDADHDERRRRRGAARHRAARQRRHAARRRPERVRRAGDPARGAASPTRRWSCCPGCATTRAGSGCRTSAARSCEGTEQRASGALGLHVLEVLLAVRDAARDGRDRRRRLSVRRATPRATGSPAAASKRAATASGSTGASMRGGLRVAERAEGRRRRGGVVGGPPQPDVRPEAQPVRARLVLVGPPDAAGVDHPPPAGGAGRTGGACGRRRPAARRRRARISREPLARA